MARTRSRRRLGGLEAWSAQRVDAIRSRTTDVLHRAAAAGAIQAVWLPFAATRLAVLLAGYAGVLLLGFQPATVRFRISSNELINLAARWDAQWYLAIATGGYHWNGNADLQQPVVFFPLLPMAMHVGRFIAGVHLLNGGLLAAICAFFFALVYLYRMAAPLIGDPRAKTALWALADSAASPSADLCGLLP